MDIDYRIIEIIKQINYLDYQCLIVGGAVRNYLLNYKINEYDLATNIPFTILQDHFKIVSKKVLNDIVVSVKIVYQKLKVDITFFRSEAFYVNNLPQKITLLNSYKEDSERRDFSINAIAYDLNEGYLDYHNGLKHINEKLVTIINSQDRYFEDAIRMIKAIRLSSQYSLRVSKADCETILNNQKLIYTIDHKRLSKELTLIFKGSNLKQVYQDFLPLFLDLCEKELIIEKVDNSLFADNNLLFYLYLKYNLQIANKSKLFKYLLINKKVIKQIQQNQAIIETLLDDLSVLKLIYLVTHFSNKEINKYYQLLDSINLISFDNQLVYKKYLKLKLLKLSDLDIDIKKLEVSDKIKYAILKEILYLVNSKQLKNENKVLLMKFNELLIRRGLNEKKRFDNNN